MKKRARLTIAVACLVAALVSPSARAGSEDDVLYEAAQRALTEARPNDAVAAFEALADRGVLDASVSFDRAVAYATRVKLAVDVPGDLGQAAHGFEEARLLSRDKAVQAEAQRALEIVRGEVARRRARAGEPVDLEKGEPLGRTLVRLAPEAVWAAIALAAGLALGVGLFGRGLARSREGRLAANVAIALAGPVLAFAALLAFAAQRDRRNVHDGVIVAPVARLADERGIALPAGTLVPEGARVSVLETRGNLARILWGGTEAWVQASTIRLLAST